MHYLSLSLTHPLPLFWLWVVHIVFQLGPLAPVPAFSAISMTQPTFSVWSQELVRRELVRVTAPLSSSILRARRASLTRWHFAQRAPSNKRAQSVWHIVDVWFRFPQVALKLPSRYAPRPPEFGNVKAEPIGVRLTISSSQLPTQTEYFWMRWSKHFMYETILPNFGM